MHPYEEWIRTETRRQFFGRAAKGLGLTALYSMFGEELAAQTAARGVSTGSLPGLPHFAPRAKRAICLHMLGGAPQMDLFDHKPGLAEWFDKDLPDSVRQGQRLTAMTSEQARIPIAPSIYKFAQHGQSGAWVSELLPYTAKMVDDIAIIKTMYTEAINHEPAITFMQTGSILGGRPCVGSWLSYGLGTMNRELPTFVVINAQHSNPRANVQAISARMWSSGFLSSEYSGVALRSSGDPVLYIKNPEGVSPEVRRQMLDGVSALNEATNKELGDPQTTARIAQYEMAFRMQSSVPELADLSKEPDSSYALYGEDARKPGTFANSCLLARRLVERDVRFVQIYHRGWDLHAQLPAVLPSQCKDIDQGAYALVQDLKQRGLLDDTLVIWTGEFGRTIYSQGALTKTNYGRDHHPRCFAIWMAGAGIKAGLVYGETDEFSYNIVRDRVHVRDWQATLLQLFGINHQRLSVKYLGLDTKLTGVEEAHVVKGLLA